MPGALAGLDRQTPITASMLYSLALCPHRVTMDLFGDPKQRDAVSRFVQFLRDRGQAHEQEVMAALKTLYTDLSGYEGEEQEALTIAAMNDGVPLIYSGRIEDDCKATRVLLEGIREMGSSSEGDTA